MCEDCSEALLKVEEPYCSICGESFEGVITEDFVCPNCGGLEMAFDFARARLRNSERARELVHGLKYRRQRYLGPDMAGLMADAFRGDERFSGVDWLLVPVPLHWLRKMKRHFNQSEELTIHLAKILNLPWQNLLVRARHTDSQTKLGRKKRMSNLEQVFRLSKGANMGSKPLNIILVDDVLTTGSTAHQCAKVLKQLPQVEKVVVLTLLRG